MRGNAADGCDRLKPARRLAGGEPAFDLLELPERISGLAVGLEHERAGTIRKGGEWMIAFAQVSVPIYTVIMRRSFGVAGNNYATPKSRHPRAGGRARPAADVGIPPKARIDGYSAKLAEAADPAARRLRSAPGADRPAEPLPDGGDDRPARHPPAQMRVGRERVACSSPCRRGLGHAGARLPAVEEARMQEILPGVFIVEANGRKGFGYAHFVRRPSDRCSSSNT